MDWKIIGFFLKLTKDDIITVDKEYKEAKQKQKPSEIMLGKWKEKFSSKATYQAFIEALLLCGKLKASDIIEACKVIASSKCMIVSKH